MQTNAKVIMKVQQIPQQTTTPNQQKVQFKGALDSSLRFFATNQAIGANAIDLASMVAPRSISDTAKRGPAAGLETFRREVMGTVNDTCVGLFGAAAGALIANGINKKFGMNVNKLFTAPETLNILAENKSEQIKDKKSQLEYIKKTLSNVKAYNPTSEASDAEGFVKLSQKTIDESAEFFDKALTKKMNFNEWAKDGTADAKSVIINKITEDTGAQSRYILESADKKIKSETSLKSLLNDIYIVSDSFNNKKVNAAFEEQIKSGKTVKENAFIKGVTKFMKSRAGAGFAIASAIGLSVQPINMYLTKLKTGTDGFVGVEGRSKDDSAGFKGIKVASSAAFFSMILATLNMSPLKFLKAPSKFMDKMAFTGKMPTVNQLKGIYGVTIISRIFSARDKDELREVLTKDTLGYLSWLVLGDIINKLAADGLDKTVMNYKKGMEKCTNPFKRTFSAALKTRDEILIETLAKNGKSTTKKVGDKTIAKTFKELEKDIETLSPQLQKATKKRLRVLNAAQLSGYLFSGLVLGLGIPNLNIYVTNMLDKKRKAAQAKEQKVVA